MKERKKEKQFIFQLIDFMQSVDKKIIPRHVLFDALRSCKVYIVFICVK